MEGWIKLHRSILNWEWYSDKACKILFLHCLLRANHKSAEWKGIHINAGSFVTSVKHLSSETGLSVQEVRSASKRLINTDELTINSTNKYSLYTITNWGLYQVREEVPTNNQQTGNKQPTPKKNNKKTYSEDFLKLWQLRDSGTKASAFNAFNKRVSEGYLPRLMFMAWERYLMECHKNKQDRIKHLSSFLGKAGEIPIFLQWVTTSEEAQDEDGSVSWQEECNENNLYPLLNRMKEAHNRKAPTLVTGNQARLVYTMLTQGCPPDDALLFKMLVKDSNNKLTNRPPDKLIVNAKYTGEPISMEFNA